MPKEEDRLYLLLEQTYTAFNLDDPSKKMERDTFRGAVADLKSLYLSIRLHSTVQNQFWNTLYDEILLNYFTSEGMGSLSKLTSKAAFLSHIAKAIEPCLESDTINLQLLDDKIKKVQGQSKESQSSTWLDFFTSVFYTSPERILCSAIMDTAQHLIETKGAKPSH